ncbi:MAG: ribosome maturation factor RimM [Thermoleophilaceae bacterium]
MGRVGRPHGRDGSFYLDAPADPPGEGAAIVLAGREARVERRGGTQERPLMRVSGVFDRVAAAALRGEPLLDPAGEAPLGAGEWSAESIVGCTIEGLGEVRRIVAGPSCDVLEVGETGVLVPFISDAIRRVDPEARLIEVDRAFLGLAPADAEKEGG